MLPKFLPRWKRIHSHNIQGKRVKISWFVVYCQSLESILLIAAPLSYWTHLCRSQDGSSLQHVSQGSTQLAVKQIEPAPTVLVALA